MRKKLCFFGKIINEITNVLFQVSKRSLYTFKKEIKNAKRIYVYGEGRSGLVAKNLAIRLVKQKKECCVIGETVMPEVKNGDLAILFSGSGETLNVINVAKICRIKGAKIIVFTAALNSPLCKLADFIILIPAKLPKRVGEHYQLRELLGIKERPATKSLFELCALIFIETVTEKIYEGK